MPSSFCLIENDEVERFDGLKDVAVPVQALFPLNGILLDDTRRNCLRLFRKIGKDDGAFACINTDKTETRLRDHWQTGQRSKRRPAFDSIETRAYFFRALHPVRADPADD